MRILVDMDDVLADFEGGFLKRWREKHPHKPFIPLKQRTTYYLTDQYPEELEPLVNEIRHEPGFYRNLKPVPGSREALREMQEMGFQVFICSSPLPDYRDCVLEKYEWVEEHLGMNWVEWIILTKDKTVIRGDVLIDDAPKVQGVQDPPSWEHVFYDFPYNRKKTGRRLTWSNWKRVLLPDRA